MNEQAWSVSKVYTRHGVDDMFPLELRWHGAGWYAAGDHEDDPGIVVIEFVDGLMSRPFTWLERATNRRGLGLAFWLDSVPAGYEPAPSMPWYFMWVAGIVVRGVQTGHSPRDANGRDCYYVSERQGTRDLRSFTIRFENGLPVRACITFDLGRDPVGVYREYRIPQHMSNAEAETWWCAAMMRWNGYNID